MSLIFLPQTLNLESSIFTNLDKRFAIRKCPICFVAVLISLTNDFSDSLLQLPFFMKTRQQKLLRINKNEMQIFWKDEI